MSNQQDAACQKVRKQSSKGAVQHDAINWVAASKLS